MQKAERGGNALTKPSSKPVLHLVVLQTRPVEEEARRAVTGIDGDELPFYAPLLSAHSLL